MARTQARKQIDVNKIVGRIGDEFVILDYVFDDGEAFRGAVGTILRPVPNHKAQKRRENASEELEEQWKSAVAADATTAGLDEWAENVVNSDGDDALWDRSYFHWHAEVCRLYNAELPEDHDPDDEAEFCECTGGGRCFYADGAYSTRFKDFDRTYVGRKVLNLIAKHEAAAVPQ